jgi:hypothetical protein
MITTLTVILAVAAGQTAEPASGPVAPSAPPIVQKNRAARTTALPDDESAPSKFSLVKEGSPILKWGTPSRCLVRGDVYYRVQCDDESKRCLVAPDAELSPDAEATSRLERAPECAGPALLLSDLTSRGYTVVPALAEAPPGWYRDERQRVMQFDFDLNARYYLGGGAIFLSDGPWSGGAVISGGGRYDRPFTWWDAPALARMHFLEGWAGSSGKQGELLIFGIDASRVYPTPLLRITTFVGKPRRYDPPLYFGLWGEGLRMEFLETNGGKTFDRTMIVNGAVTVDVFRSRDLSDFVRLRAGGGYEQAMGGDWSSFVSHAALESELTFGDTGSHHLRASALGELLTNSGDGLPTALAANRTRLTAKAEYEFVVLALNNQPLSIALEAKAQKRDDVPDYTKDWIGYAGAQLRFSLWAPPRRDAKPQDSL